MPKRKRTKKDAFEHSNKAADITTTLSDNKNNAVELDLRGHAKTTDELKLYLREQCNNTMQ